MRYSRSLQSTTNILLLILLILGLAGCITTKEKSKELARVAKDWCLTIRASQVMPVYPLTRDLRPGDVFITTTPIGKEVDLFEEKGFLPLDVHMKRLDTDAAIKAFYATRLGDGAAFPNPVNTWTDLPAAAFPDYTVEISRSGGINLAIPVQGIPVGLSYLGAAAASATVSLKGAQTAGLDLATLQPILQTWEIDNRGLLSAYATDPADPKATPVFLRIVTRVYRVKSVSVYLDDASKSGAEAAAGFELPTPDPGAPDPKKTAAEQYEEIATRLNTKLTDQLGGKVRLINVSRRSVTMDEDFPEAMCIGYIAYDCQILPGGVLSAPVPSYQRLTGAATAETAPLNSASFVQAWYTADEAARVPLIRAWITQNLTPPDGGDPPNAVSVLSESKWDLERRRMIRDLGMMPR
ncbi:MAG: hypothetical protein KF745_14915 [Phycisphaeraceae bacterium]|nr:hypothetical protein [Phycisphaeraceae bacterium]